MKLKNNPNHEKALYIRASSYLKKGLLGEAIDDCNSLIKLNPDNSNAFYVRGSAYEKLD